MRILVFGATEAALINRRSLCEVTESEHVDVSTPAHLVAYRTDDRTQDAIAPNEIRASDLLERWRHKKILVENVWKR